MVIRDKVPIMVDCPHCKGSGKIQKIKTRRKKCEECGDYGHGCFGGGNKNGLGHSFCLIYTPCFK